MNRTSGLGAGFGRSTYRVKKFPYGILPSALRTWITLRLVSGLPRRKMYLPGASATPGSSTGPLKVKNTRSSNV